MKIGLIDVDGHGFPNLALMKLSAWHKAQGDSVEWYFPIEHDDDHGLDRVYMSKVFTFTPDYEPMIFADEIVTGGTGYKDYGSLPEEIEGTFPDYSIYGPYDFAIGFLTRGCIRNCPWCIVPTKEGYIHASDTWQHIKRPDSRQIVFMDNNVLACEHGIRQIEDMGKHKIWVDFNQGLDARLIGEAEAKLLAKLHWIRFIRMSCDTSAMIPVVEQAAKRLTRAGAARSRLWCYVLVQEVDEAHERVEALRKIGITPFAQPYRDYNGGEITEEQMYFANWVNKKSCFNSCSWEEFRRTKMKENT